MKQAIFLLYYFLPFAGFSQIADSSANLKIVALDATHLKVTNLQGCTTQEMINYSGRGSADTAISIAANSTVTVVLPVTTCTTIKVKPVKSCTGGGGGSDWLKVLMPCTLPIRYNRVERPIAITRPTKFQVYSMMGVHITDVVISDFKQVKQALNSLPISTYILKSDDNVIKYFNR